MTLQDSFKPTHSIRSPLFEPTKDSTAHIAPSNEKDNDKESALQGMSSSTIGDGTKEHTIMSSGVLQEDSGRERLKRHRIEVAGNVWIPDIWGQEELLKDCIDCSAFDAALFPSEIMSAREALVDEGRRANSGGLTIENRC